MLTRVCAMVCAVAMLAGPVLAHADEPVVVPTPKRLVLGLQTSATVYRTGATGGRATKMGGGGSSGRFSQLAVAGMITLGVSYGFTVIGGEFARRVMFDDIALQVGAGETVTKLWIPVFGPLLALANQKTVQRNCDDFGGCNQTNIDVANKLILLGGLAQLTGAVLLVRGLLRGRPAAPAKEGSRRVYSMAPLSGGGIVYVAGSF